MANPFDTADIASADAFNDTFAETITYYPRAGGSRSISGTVLRMPPDDIEGGGRAPLALITVKNSDTEGISSAELDRGGDDIGYSVNIGAAATRRPIKNWTLQSAGMIEVEVR